jgi:hypothetical protein
MYCPQCGVESSSGLQYCRQCGANLKVIGKAVSLSEAIARSDRGPLPKIKEMMKSLKIQQVTEDISHALDQMNEEIVSSSGELKPINQWWPQKKEKTAEQRRENHIVHGTISLFVGIALMVVLYFVSGALVLKLPPDVVREAPFEIEPLVRVIWLVGLLPAMAGLGRIIAGLTIRPKRESELEPSSTTNELPPRQTPASVTERTTNILHRDRR